MDGSLDGSFIVCSETFEPVCEAAGEGKRVVLIMKPPARLAPACASLVALVAGADGLVDCIMELP